MLQAGNHRPTEVTLWSSGAVTADKPEYFFLERYRAAYAAEMAHFFDVLAGRAPRAHVDRRRRQGARAGRGRDDFVARKAHRRAMNSDCAVGHRAGSGRMGRRHAENLARRVPQAELVAACDPSRR